jgi:hypothetical protein
MLSPAGSNIKTSWQTIMELAQLNRWCSLAGKFGTLCFVLALLALLDGLIGQFREPSNLVKLLPGTSVDINGELVEEVKGVQELTVLSDTEQLQVTFAAVHKGYFLGGDMWRGRLVADSRILPGEYHLNVLPKSSSSTRKTPSFRILVYANALSLQESSKSFLRSSSGISPFVAAGACVPGILLAFGMVYWLAGKREDLLAREGKAEIYRAERREGGCEIRFGLGTQHGLRPGSQVTIHDDRGQLVGTGRVEEATPTDSLALVTTDREILAGYLVACLDLKEPRRLHVETS